MFKGLVALILTLGCAFGYGQVNECHHLHADHPFYVHEDNDARCDNCTQLHQCSQYIDENNDGQCDHCLNDHECSYFIDEDNDGQCDHCISAQQGGCHGHQGRHYRRHHS